MAKKKLKLDTIWNYTLVILKPVNQWLFKWIFSEIKAL